MTNPTNPSKNDSDLFAYRDAALLQIESSLEQEWREMWVDTGMPFLHSPDKAFIAFCKSRAKRRPLG